MFHLLTSQVSFRKDSTVCKCSPQDLLHIKSIDKKELTESHFSLQHLCEQWKLFCRSTFINMCNTDIKPVIIALRDHMPSWTADTVVYTTVDEAYSGSVNDVGSYLVKLKNDLKIGEEGYPSYIVIGGDQQTYAHACVI